MTMSELLIVVVIAAIVFMLAIPKIAVTRDGAGRRAARSQLIAAFAATRGAALQKGKSASLALTSSTATVTVLSGLASNEFTAWGPIDFTNTLGEPNVNLNGARRGPLDEVLSCTTTCRLQWDGEAGFGMFIRDYRPSDLSPDPR